MQIHSPASPFASSADVAACRDLLRGGSRTFFAASLALPGGVRNAATGLYAFCRMADDAIDQGADRDSALRDLQARLEGIYRGSPADLPADRAFGDCVASHAIPKALPLALLEGFAWDARMRRYETFSQLTSYAVRVAGTVGVMMAMVMGVRDARSLARACDLGVAMQLTNIARDVGEDARCGRLYLPQQWLREAGIDPHAWLADPRFSPTLAGVIERLLAAADELYARSESGLAALPAACRPGMFAARLLYAEIGHELARRRYDSVTQRAVVPWRRKAVLLADAVLAAARRSAAGAAGGALQEALFLIDPLACAAPAPARRSRIENRVAWLVDLFERLERRERSYET
jgi:phytoene synthase